MKQRELERSFRESFRRNRIDENDYESLSQHQDSDVLHLDMRGLRMAI